MWSDEHIRPPWFSALVAWLAFFTPTSDQDKASTVAWISAAPKTRKTKDMTQIFSKINLISGDWRLKFEVIWPDHKLLLASQDKNLMGIPQKKIRTEMWHLFSGVSQRLQYLFLIMPRHLKWLILKNSRIGPATALIMDDELDRAAKKHRLQQRSGALRARLAQNRAVPLKVLAWIRDTLLNHDILNFHGFTTFKTKFLILWILLIYL